MLQCEECRSCSQVHHLQTATVLGQVSMILILMMVLVVINALGDDGGDDDGHDDGVGG